MIEGTLKNIRGVFDDLGLDPFIVSSTLLYLVRSGELKPMTLDFEIMAEEDTLQLREKAKEICKQRNFKVIFEEGMWVFDCLGHVEVHTVRLSRGFRYRDYGERGYLIWPKRHYEKWLYYSILDRLWKIPSDPEGWLETYYGKDWRTEQEFSWSNHAQNLLKP